MLIEDKAKPFYRLEMAKRLGVLATLTNSDQNSIPNTHIG